MIKKHIYMLSAGLIAISTLAVIGVFALNLALFMSAPFLAFMACASVFSVSLMAFFATLAKLSAFGYKNKGLKVDARIEKLKLSMFNLVGSSVAALSILSLALFGSVASGLILAFSFCPVLIFSCIAGFSGHRIYSVSHEVGKEEEDEEISFFPKHTQDLRFTFQGGGYNRTPIPSSSTDAFYKKVSRVEIN